MPRGFGSDTSDCSKHSALGAAPAYRSSLHHLADAACLAM